MKNTIALEGECLSTKGTKMNERHTFECAHPQASSYILIKRSTPVVPVLLGPQIPRQDREETRERYCRAILTLFIPWRTVEDLCNSEQTWSDAFEMLKPMISSNGQKVIQNIQLLHECKKERDEHLLQVIIETPTDDNIDPILVSNGPMETDDPCEDDIEELLQMLSFLNESTMSTHLDTSNNREQRYIDSAIRSIDNSDRFVLLSNDGTLCLV